MATQTNFPITKATVRPAKRPAFWGMRTAETITEKTERLLSAFDPISLAEMEDVALLNRTDTKFVMPVDSLLKALGRLPGFYRALEIEGRRLHHYQSLYFDSPEFITYQHHHNGRCNRYKVRFRRYLDSGLAFLEVKCRNNKNRTIKKRVRRHEINDRLSADDKHFISGHYPYEVRSLAPSLWNNFHRITLVSTQRKERLTLDINLGFGDHKAISGLPGIAIAEVKQEGFSMESDFIYQMRWQGIRPSGFSKYCIGTAIINPHLKRNRFKTKLLMVDKMMQGEHNHVYAS